ncbi:uncharacterized protein LOC105765560 [Gossypium raimondii]|uniref:Uncharacterized protein n=1 Tax=Gossypium raimondii TaxID=29730 RepID=A0A0D2TE27_GOSRA|nr:uncharacterized protein LOC105765560 [Gossypium raimondii]KJB52816.1 hypothetical protein B456_008G279000 [Gossypium raimondii]
MNSHVLPGNNQNESWTDEKHVRFLNSMEAWFVRTMLENNDLYHLRLDRHLPDSSESTLDCKRHNVQSRRKHASSDSIITTRSKMKVKTDKRSKRPSSSSQPQRYDSSEDQVVPEIINRTDDEDGEKRSFPSKLILKKKKR